MAKHVSFMIGCIILSLSATLIVPTNCLPIEENGQKETNFLESRSKRQAASATSSSNSKATASTQSIQNPLFLSALLPLLAKGGQTNPPPVSAGGSGGLSGLSGLLFGLNPVLGSLSGLLGNLGGTVNGVVGQVENGVPLLTPITDLLQQIITALLGGGGGGLSFPPISGASKPPAIPLSLLALLSQSQIKQTATATSSSNSQATASVGPKG